MESRVGDLNQDGDLKQGSGDILERDVEVRALQAAINQAASGSGQLVAIEGPAGIGKSSLLRIAEPLARSAGLTVYSASCHLAERDYGFGVVRQLFEVSGKQSEAAHLFEGTAARAAGPVLGVEQSTGPVDTTFATLHSLYWYVVGLLDSQAAALLVDDVHWCDDASWRFLEFLAARLRDLPLVIVLAARGDADRPLRALGAGMSLIRPRHLSTTAVRALLTRTLGEPDPEFVLAVVEATGANPFYVTELARALRHDAITPVGANRHWINETRPETIEQSVLQRIGALGERALQIARTVAAAGPMPTALLADITDLPRGSVDDCIELLIDQHVFANAEITHFAHPILAAAVARDMGPRERAKVRRVCAEALAGSGAPASKTAMQLLDLDPTSDAWVVQQLLAAAAETKGRGALREAVTYLERALAEAPESPARAAVLAELVEVGTALQRPTAVKHLLAARDLMPSGPERAELSLALARIHGVTGGYDAAVAACQDARIDAAGDRELLLYADAAEWFAAALSSATCGPRLAEIRKLPASSCAEKAALTSVAINLSKTDAPARGIRALADRALKDGPPILRGPGDVSGISAVTVYHLMGDPARASSIASMIIDQAQRAGSPMLVSLFATLRAVQQWELGRLLDGLADLELAAAAAGEVASGVDPWASYAITNLLIDSGDLASAHRHIQAYRSTSVPPVGVIAAAAQCAHGRVALATGEPLQALEGLLQAGKTFERYGVTNPTFGRWRSYATAALVTLGRRDEARANIQPAMDASEAIGVEWIRADALRHAAMVDPAAAVDLLTEAAALVEDADTRLVWAEVTVDLGAALRRTGQRAAARDRLIQPLAWARSAGAQPLAERAASELAALGVRTSPSASAAPMLTPSELRVAELAAAGATNREIAQTLFITEKTVEKHLSNTYLKLGIVGRRHLPGHIPRVRA